MKKLLNTLYVTTPNVYLSLDGETVVLLQEQHEMGRVPPAQPGGNRLLRL